MAEPQISTLPLKDGTRLRMRHVPAADPRAAVLIVHGVTEHSERYQHLEDWLTRRCISCYSYDHRGHGGSSGDTVDIDSFDTYLKDLHFVRCMVAAGTGVPLFVYGHSMGALIAACYADAYPTGLKGAVLSAPPLELGPANPRWLAKLAAAMGRLLPMLTFRARTRPELLTSDPDEQRAILEDVGRTQRITLRWLRACGDGIERTRRVLEKPQLPTLIVHGDGDRIADISGSRAVVESNLQGGVEITDYAGGGHELHNEHRALREEMFEDVSWWMEALL